MAPFKVVYKVEFFKNVFLAILGGYFFLLTFSRSLITYEIFAAFALLLLSSFILIFIYNRISLLVSYSFVFDEDGITTLDKFNNFYSFTPKSYIEAWFYEEYKEDDKIVKTLALFTSHGILEFNNNNFSNFKELCSYTFSLNLPRYSSTIETNFSPFPLPNKSKSSIYFWTFYGVFLYIMFYFFFFSKDYKNLGYSAIKGTIQSIQIEDKYNIEIKLYEYPHYTFQLSGKKAYDRFNTFNSSEQYNHKIDIVYTKIGQKVEFKVATNKLKMLRKYKLIEELEFFWDKNIDLQVIEFKLR